MATVKTLAAGPAAGDLAALLSQLSEQRMRVEELLAQVDKALRSLSAAGGSDGGLAREGVARRSPLDGVQSVIAATADLREPGGNLSAASVAKVYGVSLSQLAGWLGRSKQSVSKTPDADSLQEVLGYFERIARLRLVTGNDAGFRKWLRMPHPDIAGRSPMDLLAKHRWQALADFADDILTGSPG